MNKLEIAKIIVTCMGSCILFALFAFAMWDMNPINWGIPTRIFYGVFVVLLGLIVGSMEKK